MKLISALLIATSFFAAPAAHAASSDTMNTVREILAKAPDSSIEFQKGETTYWVVLSPTKGLLVSVSNTASSVSWADMDVDGVPNFRIEGIQMVSNPSATEFDNALQALIDSKK